MKTSEAVAALAALAQDTRLNVYRLLVQQGDSGLAAGEIAAALGVTPATLSFHLKELARAGLIKACHEGRYIYYSADFAAMRALLDFLTEKCCGGDAHACLPARSAPSRSARPRVRA